MKFIFQTMPAFGHLNPMLGVAGELVNQGHQVIIYNTKKFKENIENVGAEFREVPLTDSSLDIGNLRVLHNAITIADFSTRATELLADPLIAEITKEKPDCLLHDSLSLWGKIAGLKTHVPTVALVPSMAINTRLILNQTPLLLQDYAQALAHPHAFLSVIGAFFKMYAQRGLVPPPFFDIFSNAEKLNIVFTSRQFQPLERSFDEKYAFVGPIVYDRKEPALPHRAKGSKPIIYAALGTVYNDNVAVYRSILAALKEVDCEAYVSIGSYITAAELGTVPQHIHLAPYFPQLDILSKASVFISHCGMNSVNESLYFGVPLLMLPIIQEQKMNAKRVEALGAGIYYTKPVTTTPELVKAIRTLLAEKKYTQAAQGVGKTLSASGGAKKAVERILAFVG